MAYLSFQMSSTTLVVFSRSKRPCAHHFSNGCIRDILSVELGPDHVDLSVGEQWRSSVHPQLRCLCVANIPRLAGLHCASGIHSPFSDLRILSGTLGCIGRYQLCGGRELQVNSTGEGNQGTRAELGESVTMRVYEKR